VFQDLLPLPVWRTPFQGGTFAQAAVIGFVLPFAAAAWPVWRAVRIQPVEAIRVGHLAARGNGLAPLLRQLKLPGRGYHQIPLRNVLRTPRRSALTLLGIAAAIATLVTIVGLLDTFRATLDTASAGLLRAAPARVTVSLDSHYPADGGGGGTGARPARGRAGAGRTASTRHGAQPRPCRGRGGRGAARRGRLDAAAVRRSPGRRTGAVPARPSSTSAPVWAAWLPSRHPQVVGGGLRMVDSQVRVAGIDSNPMRVYAYLDSATAAPLFGLPAMANLLTVLPSAGHSAADVQRALLDVPHVASAESVQVATDGLRAS
jgi:putative ABC transport system permease protein